LVPPERPARGVVLATSWVEPAYLEPDASWCAPGGEPASALANGGAFGGKQRSAAPAAARELADRFGRPVRVVWSREDVVRLGPKRPPVALAAEVVDDGVMITGSRARPVSRAPAPPNPYGIAVDDHSIEAPNRLPIASMRASEWAETAIVVEGALHAAGFERGSRVDDRLAGAVLLDTCVGSPEGAWAGARVVLDDATSAITRVEARLAAGDPLDETVLRSYCIGAVHQALGWVLSEGLAVDDETGEILDLTIRSFGIVRPKAMPPVDIALVADARPPVPHASDAMFVAVAAAAWIAVGLPESWPALSSPASQHLRR
jgi:CO/xanthine dehydrogenase Mo-binding subunit